MPLCPVCLRQIKQANVRINMHKRRPEEEALNFEDFEFDLKEMAKPKELSNTANSRPLPCYGSSSSR